MADTNNNGGQSTESTEYIILKVVDSYANQTTFRLNVGVKMVKIKIKYAEVFGIDVSRLEFLFDGLRINDDDTPRSLGMEQDDVIEAYLKLNSRSYHAPTMRETMPETNDNARQPTESTESIVLKFVFSENAVLFCTKVGVHMAKMKKKFAELVGINVSTLRFLCDGRRLNDDDTPRSLGLKQDDVVDVYLEQYGGGDTDNFNYLG